MRFYHILTADDKVIYELIFDRGAHGCTPVNYYTNVKITGNVDTDKWTCREIARALTAFGVREVVTSPGSRNTPLLMAVARNEQLRVHSAIDERSAAFIALGMSSVSQAPVALICTSGTAMLNYAPAIAEAYYRHLPLIAITADRPACWIDQDDSQTIRQPGALSNITVGSCDIDGEASTGEQRWNVNRSLNDTLLAATEFRRGPVHINVRLATPLTNETRIVESEPFRRIAVIRAAEKITTDNSREIARKLQGKRVLVVGGFNPPSGILNRALTTLSSLPSVAVLCEGLANVHARGCLQFCDADIRPLNEDADRCGGGLYLRPDVLITFGGALVSAQMKQYLRRVNPTEHWHVGENQMTIDCFMSLTARVEISPEGFFPRVANALAHLERKHASEWEYNCRWHKYIAGEQNKRQTSVLSWSALKAISTIISSMPRQWNLQLGNGMTVRQAMQCDLSKVHRADSNRGVSGIDGSVSTSVGAAFMSASPTLLITGDMGMQYDLGALTSNIVDHRLKIVVINNGGGGIFHYVQGASKLPEMPSLLNCSLKLPLKQLADAFGFRYAHACDMPSLNEAIDLMLTENKKPVMIEVTADADTDAAII